MQGLYTRSRNLGGYLGTLPTTPWLPLLLPSVLRIHRVNMFFVNNNCKLDFKLDHVTNLITIFQPVLIPFVLKIKFLLMTYKIICDLTPVDYFLDFISHRWNLSSLPTASLAFCLIFKHSKLIPTPGPLHLLCPLSGVLFTSYLHDWPLLAI